MSTESSSVRKRSEVLRYLLVGACNTGFGYGLFALLTMLLTPLMTYGYVLASLLANLLSITFAFLGYKWFVFRTQGNYLQEWIRCVGVYSVSILFSVVTLPIAVAVIRRHDGFERSAPYFAGAAILLISITFSFFGHRRISFGVRNRDAELTSCRGTNYPG